MMLTLPNAPGLNLKLRNVGLGIEHRCYDGRPSEFGTADDAAAQAVIDAYTVADEQAYACALIETHATDLRNAVIAGTSPGEIASWPLKLAQAGAYAASGNAADAPMLVAEAAARGCSLDMLIVKVDSNAMTLAALEAGISGTSGRHRDAIKAFTTFDQIAGYNWHTGWPGV